MGFLCPRRTPPSPVVRLIMRLVKASGLCGRRCALFVGDLFASAVPRSGLSCPVALWRARAQSGAGRLPTRSSAVFLSRVRAAFVQRASWPARGTAGCAEDAAGPTIRSGRTRVEARSSADKAAPLAVARPLTEFCQVVAFFLLFGDMRALQFRGCACLPVGPGDCNLAWCGPLPESRNPPTLFPLERRLGRGGPFLSRSGGKGFVGAAKRTHCWERRHATSSSKVL